MNVNSNNFPDNDNRVSFGIALASRNLTMQYQNNLYNQIISFENLILAWKKARKGKTKKDYVIKFEEQIFNNLMSLHYELKHQTYRPSPLTTFILRDPKIRKISKSNLRDRIVHHAIVNILEPLFEKTFIYDSYANRKGKGTLKAMHRFHQFIKKVSKNGKLNGWLSKNQVKGYCLKADIKHYFQEINHEILLKIIKRKIKNKKAICLIQLILKNYFNKEKGMPLGNMTSQFFANIYLNELDQFVKKSLKARYYIRYVDDFVILDSVKENLVIGGGRLINS